MTERTVFIHESSKTLDCYSTEESDLSYQEQIDKAKDDCLHDGYFRTMSPTYLQAFILYADLYGVLKHWKFVILKDDGTSVDVTDHTEEAFAMMTKPIDGLFEIGFEA